MLSESQEVALGLEVQHHHLGRATAPAWEREKPNRAWRNAARSEVNIRAFHVLPLSVPMATQACSDPVKHQSIKYNQTESNIESTRTTMIKQNDIRSSLDMSDDNSSHMALCADVCSVHRMHGIASRVITRQHAPPARCRRDLH